MVPSNSILKNKEVETENSTANGPLAGSEKNISDNFFTDIHLQYLLLGGMMMMVICFSICLALEVHKFILMLEKGIEAILLIMFNAVLWITGSTRSIRRYEEPEPESTNTVAVAQNLGAGSRTNCGKLLVWNLLIVGGSVSAIVYLVNKHAAPSLHIDKDVHNGTKH